MPCPADPELLAFARGNLRADAQASTSDHVAGCESCRNRAAGLLSSGARTELASAFEDTVVARPTPGPKSAATARMSPGQAASEEVPPPAPIAPPGSLSRGDNVGRYVVLELLGSGGMGEVYTAYDPQLDRKVALKLLRAGVVEADEARQRLLREAQAMARLAHPNVIAVHDVGTFEDRVFVAMEFVDGCTLTDWLKEKHRWQEIVARFRDAGTGLSAAHAAGLVHRDFKPDNVLVGKDGRIRVLDFGLARQVIAADGSEDRTARQRRLETIRLTGTDSGVLGRQLTQDGMILGTPAYMSLEQLEGAATDARTDQFSFCVALYEALYHARPYTGETLGHLATAMHQGKFTEPPRDSKVPAFVHHALVRGLAARPDARFPTMDALLAELGRDPARRRRRWYFAGGVAAGMVAMAAVPVVVSHHRADACSVVVKQLDGIWDGAQRERIHQKFRATQVPFADDTFQRVSTMLSAYVAGWTQLERQVCLDTASSSAPKQELALRGACLEQRLDQLREMSKVLASADSEVVENGVAEVQALEDLKLCSDVDALAANVQLVDPANREQVEEVHARLAHAKVLLQAGKYRDGIAPAQQALAKARALKDRTLEAEAWYVLGQLQGRSADRASAVDSYHEAVWAAEAARRDDLATLGWARLLLAESYAPDRDRNDQQLVRSVTAAMERLHRNDDVEGEVENSLGVWARSQNRLDEAKAHFQKALALKEKAHGPEHPDVALQLNNVGDVLTRQGKTSEARPLFERALALLEKAYGPAHPSVAGPLNNLGVLVGKLGDFAKAQELLSRALKIRQSALGPDHPSVATTMQAIASAQASAGDRASALVTERSVLTFREHHNDSRGIVDCLVRIANLERGLHRPDDAIESLQRALAIAGEGGASAQQAAVYEALASVHRQQGHDADALSAARKAIAIDTSLLGANDSATGHAVGTLAELELAQGNAERAQQDFERALAIHDAADPKSPDNLVRDLLGLGSAQLAAHHTSEALSSFERALQLGDTVAPDTQARLKVSVARVLIDGNRDPARAQALLADAKALYTQTPALHGSELKEIAELSGRLTRSATPERMPVIDVHRPSNLTVSAPKP